jgi:hypothetical protein
MDNIDKLAAIERIVELHERAMEDDDGDKYQADPDLAMQAISCVLAGIMDMGCVRDFLGSKS